MDEKWLLLANRRNIAYVTVIMERMENGNECALNHVCVRVRAC